MDCHAAERLVTPYLDGELDMASVVQVEEHLAACASCGKLLGELEQLRQEIAAAGLHFSPAPRLKSRIETARRKALPRQQGPLRYPVLLAAAACVILLLAVATYRLLLPDTAGRELLDSHLRSLMAAHLVDVESSDQHTVKPWFQGKLAFSPNVPDLEAQGFSLVGGRLEIVGRRPAAAIVYKRRRHIINLFITPGSAAAASARTETIEGYHVVRWTINGMTYWAVSDLNDQELRRFAALAGMK